MSSAQDVDEVDFITERVGFGLFEPASRANPYPVYHRLREQAPIYRSPTGIWILSRYADVATVLRDSRFGYGDPRAPRARALLAQKEQGSLLRDARGKSVSSFLTQNPPQHTRLRKFVAPAFAVRSVERHVPRITKLVDGLLETALADGDIDFVDAFAYLLPFTVLCEILGIPAADRELVRGWSRTLARGLDPEFLLPPERVEQRVQALLETAVYFNELTAERRRQPREDLLSALVTAEEDGDVLTSAELLSTCILMLVAGHESTASLLAGGVLSLLNHPDQLARLHAEPALAATAVDELLRYDPPPQLVFRTALADVPLGEELIPSGDMVIALIGAANRDPAEFPVPDRLDLTRTRQRHLGFSQGIHFCLGAPLARLEIRIALQRLMERTSSLALTGEPQWKPNIALRGLETLPVTLYS